MADHKSTKLFIPLMLAAWGIIVPGCVNSPEALVMTVVPEKGAFAVGEPIRLNVTVTAKEGPVCLSRAPHFRVDLQALPGQEALSNGPRVLCGGAVLAALPLWPVALLDVGDVMGRYRVLPKDREIRLTLDVVPRTYGTLRVDAQEVGSEDRGLAEVTDAKLVPGTYRAHTSLSPLASSLPAPLFWKEYDQPLEAETTFRIPEEIGNKQSGERISDVVVCPKCGAKDSLPIGYGLPGPEMVAAYQRGELWLGGCCLRFDDRHCKACGHEWDSGKLRKLLSDLTTEDREEHNPADK